MTHDGRYEENVDVYTSARNDMATATALAAQAGSTLPTIGMKNMSLSDDAQAQPLISLTPHMPPELSLIHI